MKDMVDFKFKTKRSDDHELAVHFKGIVDSYVELRMRKDEL